MYDHESGEWVLEGKALNVDSLFRTRDYMSEQAFLEMRKHGFIPMGSMPVVDVGEIEEDGKVSFAFRWKCVPVNA